jgi:hypothetical protein
MAGREIDWASAKVKDSTLTVQVGGDSDGAKEWSGRVQSVLRVLDRSGGKWGEIKVSQEKIQVADLREGSEPDLRHLLESAVLQANSDLAPDKDDDADDGEDADEEARSGDQKMTDAFRAFASDSSEDDHDEDERQGERDKRDSQ